VNSTRYLLRQFLRLHRVILQTISIRGRDILIILQTKGIFNEGGEIVLNSNKTIYWKDLSDKNLPHFPAGTSIDLSISCDENIFLSGLNKIVWATYDLRQAEIIQSTLVAQHINCEVKSISIKNENMFLISINSENETIDAIDFIWKSKDGLRLKPDWHYDKGEKNKSFEQWLSGH
jgi:hypothetical protein